MFESGIDISTATAGAWAHECTAGSPRVEVVRSNWTIPGSAQPFSQLESPMMVHTESLNRRRHDSPPRSVAPAQLEKAYERSPTELRWKPALERRKYGRTVRIGAAGHSPHRSSLQP